MPHFFKSLRNRFHDGSTRGGKLYRFVSVIAAYLHAICVERNIKMDVRIGYAVYRDFSNFDLFKAARFVHPSAEGEKIDRIDFGF